MSEILNKKNLKPALEEFKIQQRADVVWSRMTLEPNEVLLVKVAPHMSAYIRDIGEMLTHIFKKQGAGDRIVVFQDGDISFEKVAMNGKTKVSGN